jgi:NADH:ubiquinone oxidoreductase subunit 3 (subunit A)
MFQYLRAFQPDMGKNKKRSFYEKTSPQLTVIGWNLQTRYILSIILFMVFVVPEVFLTAPG